MVDMRITGGRRVTKFLHNSSGDLPLERVSQIHLMYRTGKSSSNVESEIFAGKSNSCVGCDPRDNFVRFTLVLSLVILRSHIPVRWRGALHDSRLRIIDRVLRDFLGCA